MQERDNKTHISLLRFIFDRSNLTLILIPWAHLSSRDRRMKSIHVLMTDLKIGNM